MKRVVISPSAMAQEYQILLGSRVPTICRLGHVGFSLFPKFLGGAHTNISESDVGVRGHRLLRDLAYSVRAPSYLGFVPSESDASCLSISPEAVDASRI
jgi:hypothetical protein